MSGRVVDPGAAERALRRLGIDTRKPWGSLDDLERRQVAEWASQYLVAAPDGVPDLNELGPGEFYNLARKRA